MIIYVLRHGKAVDAEEVGGNDKARTLTTGGRENTRLAARGMTRLGVKPEAIWSSPFPRALETARLTAEVLGLEEAVVEQDDLEPGARPETIAKLLGAAGIGKSVMLVGHNPDLEELIEYLISPARQAHVTLKKGALALIEAGEPIREGCGSLDGLWTVQQFRDIMKN